MTAVLGIDIGGSGIKGALVDVTDGTTLTDRVRIETPVPSTPDRVIDVVGQVVDAFADRIGDGPIGVTFPAVVQHGITRSAANVDPAWIDFPAQERMIELLGRPVVLVNDADAAGLCEARFGAAAGRSGVVVMATLGTGIGTALIHNGVLVPNTEFGHIEMNGADAEQQASSGQKDKLGLAYEEWIPIIEQYFQTLEQLLWPDLIVVGGGISADSALFLPQLQIRTPIIPARHLNMAGIIGAAVVAHENPQGL